MTTGNFVELIGSDPLIESILEYSRQEIIDYLLDVLHSDILDDDDFVLEMAEDFVSTLNEFTPFASISEIKKAHEAWVFQD